MKQRCVEETPASYESAHPHTLNNSRTTPLPSRGCFDRNAARVTAVNDNDTKNFLTQSKASQDLRYMVFTNETSLQVRRGRVLDHSVSVFQSLVFFRCHFGHFDA